MLCRFWFAPRSEWSKVDPEEVSGIHISLVLDLIGADAHIKQIACPCGKGSAHLTHTRTHARTRLLADEKIDFVEKSTQFRRGGEVFTAPPLIFQQRRVSQLRFERSNCSILLGTSAGNRLGTRRFDDDGGQLSGTCFFLPGIASYTWQYISKQAVSAILWR